MRRDTGRVLIATLLFLLLTAGSVVAAGVNMSAQIVAAPLPETFHMAEARVGDAGTYVWNRVRVESDGNVTVLNEHELIGFAWLPPGTAADAEGARHDALMLHQWGWQPKDHDADLAKVPRDGWERYAEPVFAIDLATDRILSYAYLSEATANPDNDRGHSVKRMFLHPGDRFWPACGPDSSYSGREVPLDQSVRLFRTCMGFSPILSIDAHAPVHAVGTQMLGERETLLFANDDGSLHIWYDADIPMPLRIAASTCAPAPIPIFWLRCEGNEYDVLRLTTFERGSTPLPERTSQSQPLSKAPAWEMRPLRNGLPDESGIQHPFPASSALAAAKADANGKEFREVFENGYLTRMDYHENHQQGTTTRSWFLSAYDGTRSESVSVHQRIQQADASSPALSGIPPVGSGATARSTSSVSVESVTNPDGGPWPHPGDAPATAPTVDSMWTRWRAFASDGYTTATPNEWGMRVVCLTTSDGECSVFVERRAGLELTTSTEEGSTMLTSILRESHDDLRGHEIILNEYAEAWDAQGTPIHPRSEPAQGELTILQSVVWVTPASPVIVRSAIAAVLVSLTYLVWPALRTGAVLLFTRHTTPPEVLKNAQRRKMMERVREVPGIQVQELGRSLRWSRSSTEHHLAVLRRVGLVRIQRQGATRHVFACDAPPGSAPRPQALASDIARQIVGLRRERPDLSVREVARALDVSPGTVSYHLARLRSENLLAE